MKKAGIILVVLIAFLTFGCGQQPGRDTLASGGVSLRTAAVPMSFNVEESASITSQDRFNPSGNPETAFPNPVERRLVKNAFVSIRVENLEVAANFVSNLMNVYGAHAASTSTHENSRHFSLRVPSHHYEVFLAEINNLGRLIHRTEHTEDVTLRYFDLEGRLESKRELLRTFQSYLGRANSIEEILAVEARIADLQREIEFTGTQLRHLANRVDYSTIDLSLLGPVTAATNWGVTFDERLRQLFGNFGGFLSTVAIILLGIVVYGIPSVLILMLLFWLLFGRIGFLKKLWRTVMNK